MTRLTTLTAAAATGAALLLAPAAAQAAPHGTAQAAPPPVDAPYCVGRSVRDNDPTDARPTTVVLRNSCGITEQVQVRYRGEPAGRCITLAPGGQAVSQATRPTSTYERVVLCP